MTVPFFSQAIVQGITEPDCTARHQASTQHPGYCNWQNYLNSPKKFLRCRLPRENANPNRPVLSGQTVKLPVNDIPSLKCNYLPGNAMPAHLPSLHSSLCRLGTLFFRLPELAAEVQRLALKGPQIDQHTHAWLAEARHRHQQNALAFRTCHKNTQRDDSPHKGNNCTVGKSSH